MPKAAPKKKATPAAKPIARKKAKAKKPGAVSDREYSALKADFGRKAAKAIKAKWARASSTAQITEAGKPLIEMTDDELSAALNKAQAKIDKAKPKPLESHPLAELLPPMTDAEFAALKEDIRVHGQLDDIELLDGMILDGRHRYRACMELGIAPKFRQFDKAKLGQSPTQYAYSKSMHRNLSESQKACCAVRFEPEFAKEAARRMKAGVPVPLEEKGTAAEKAGSLFGVSGRYVAMAKFVMSRDPKLFQICFQGGEPLTRANSLVARRDKTASLHAAAKAVKVALPAGCPVEVETADCIEAMNDRDLPLGAGLIVADPPYNIGIDYGDGEKADALSAPEYREWSEEWIRHCHRHLSALGTMIIVINWENCGMMIEVAESLGFIHQQHIVWYESFGTNCEKRFNRCSRPILWLTKDPEHFTLHQSVFNRPSARQSKYGDKRAVAGGKMWDDVWGVEETGKINRVTGTSKERIPAFPTQLPEALVRPIVEGFSNPGDLVIDPFSGSGTTMACCLQTGRRGLGFEKSETFAALSRLRLAAVKK